MDNDSLSNNQGKIISNIDEKLNWAVRSAEKIKIDTSNKIQVHDNFWSYLSAYQSCMNYFNRYLNILHHNKSKKEKERLCNLAISNWKETLSKEEKTTCNLLNKLRNNDHHEKPHFVNFDIVIEVLVTEYGYCLVTEDGFAIEIGRKNKCFVLYKGKEFQIESLIDNGINAIMKLIQYIPQIVIS